MSETHKTLEASRAAKYKEARAILGSQQEVAGILGISIKVMGRRERGETLIRQEAFYALRQLVAKKKKSDFVSLTGKIAVFADGTEGRIIAHTIEDGPCIEYEDDTLSWGGEFELKEPSE